MTGGVATRIIVKSTRRHWTSRWSHNSDSSQKNPDFARKKVDGVGFVFEIQGMLSYRKQKFCFSLTFLFLSANQPISKTIFINFFPHKTREFPIFSYFLRCPVVTEYSYWSIMRPSDRRTRPLALRVVDGDAAPLGGTTRFRFLPFPFLKICRLKNALQYVSLW